MSYSDYVYPIHIFIQTNSVKCKARRDMNPGIPGFQSHALITRPFHRNFTIDVKYIYILMCFIIKECFEKKFKFIINCMLVCFVSIQVQF